MFGADFKLTHYPFSGRFVVGPGRVELPALFICPFSGCYRRLDFWHEFGMTTPHSLGFSAFCGMYNQQLTQNQRPLLFINNGDKVKVDTSEARYVQRAQ
jgi:hypothetical protein